MAPTTSRQTKATTKKRVSSSEQDSSQGSAAMADSQGAEEVQNMIEKALKQVITCYIPCRIIYSATKPKSRTRANTPNAPKKLPPNTSQKSPKPGKESMASSPSTRKICKAFSITLTHPPFSNTAPAKPSAQPKQRNSPVYSSAN